MSTALSALHITEGVGGVWFYHLSNLGTKSVALCGARTMSTSLPLTSWGVRGHLNEGYCASCAKSGAEALLAAGVKLEEPIFSFDEVPTQPGARWYVRRGAKIHVLGGFKSKAEASTWIDALGPRLDWRTGFLFRLRGDSVDMEIVNRLGVAASV